MGDRNGGGVTGKNRKRSHVGAVAVLAAGLGATTLAFLAALQQQTAATQLAFDRVAYDHVETIRDAIDSKAMVLRSLQAFFEVSGEVTPASFRDFVKPLLSQTEGLQALEWIPRVTHDQRAAFEQAARASGFANFEIRVREDQGYMAPAPPRAEYFPVYYVEPLAHNEAAVGFDLASHPDRLAAIERSRHTDAPVATGGVVLVQEEKGQTGILLFLPVRTPNTADTPGSLRGFVLGVFRVRDVVEAATRRLHGCATHVALLDLDAPDHHKLLYLHSGPEASQGGWDGRGAAPRIAGVAPRASEITVGGRRWQVVCAASRTFAADITWAPWAVLVGGTMLSLMAFVYVLRLSGESRRLARAVDATKETLSRSQAQYRAVVEDQTDLVCRFRPDCTLTFANHAYASFYGKSPEQIVGVDWRTLLPEPLARLVEGSLGELTPQSPVGFHEHEVVASNGQVRWYRWTNRAMYDEGGKLCEYQAVGHDITEIHLARMSLAESQARYQAIVEDQTELVCRFGPDCVLTFVNRAYAGFWGKTTEEMLGVDWRTLVPEAAHSSVGKHLARLTRENPTATLEHEVLDAYGQIRWQQRTDHAIFDSDGGLREFQSVGRDITDRRRAELQVLREKALLRCLIDSIPDVIFFKDVHGIYLGCNPAFVKYAGRTESQIIGLTDRDMFPPEAAEAYIANDRAMLSSGQPRQNEEWIEFSDGSRMLLDTLKTPYYGPRGEILGLIGISRDITRVRKAEEAIVDVHRKLLNVREEERRRIAEELHESICQDMAALQMFLMPLADNKAAVPADTDRARLAAAGQICKAVLEKSRNICYDLYPPVLAGLGLEAGLLNMAKTADFASQEIRVRTDASYEKGAPVRGLTKIALYRTAQEALNNAIRHSCAKRIDILLSRRNAQILLEILDDGHGFDPQTARKGLGLTVMKERMLAIGGEVTFVSRPGRTVVSARISEKIAAL